MSQLPLSNDISIVLGGEAGQGIQTIEQLLTKILKLNNFYVFATKEYMSRVRGGSNTTSIRVGSHPLQAPIERVDLLIPLDKEVLPRLQHRITSQTIVAGDMEALETNLKIFDIPLKKLSKELGSEIYSNTIALGLILSLLKTDGQIMEKYLGKYFGAKGEKLVELNIKAAHLGFKHGRELLENGTVRFPELSISDIQNDIMINGSEAIAMGAIAGGCRCIASYPMSPGTGVITFMAKVEHDFELIVEQAEDEIAAINMAIGAWYAGARAMVTTSGGGFALMAEGLSLAGMLEMPVVIHLAQRPGPGTGLPTRTEQGDLELALYAGHGEFPRIILAPGSLKDAFYITQKAFNLADKFQVPVIILTDQYFVDTYYNIPSFDLSQIKVESCIIEMDENYLRYQLTDNGISPRGIPGKGKGLVGVDSDEHDEAGHITENLELRVKMVDKRLKKLSLIKESAIAAKIYGPSDSRGFIISWGSTNRIVREAVKHLGKKDLTHIALQQVYPLPENLRHLLSSAKHTIVVENNATSQLGNLILRETGFQIDHKILKYNGLPFTVEELMHTISEKIS
ncbi:MAG: 2-oxoacid:acceptor oxidoreductase subunit alpha [Proteobacteria bacterium]|nr:2-oxoacid:acceptor oxidoreductase subunit alpha [Pseudomonadota bacterium]